MLKYSTGRSKPGWGKPEYRPVWWPCDVPWANVRSDVRPDDIKKRVFNAFNYFQIHVYTCLCLCIENTSTQTRYII